MFALQIIVRRVVIKALALRKALGGVTADTRLRGKLAIKHILVFIGVTILTVAFLLPRELELFAFSRRFGS